MSWLSVSLLFTPLLPCDPITTDTDGRVVGLGRKVRSDASIFAPASRRWQTEGRLLPSSVDAADLAGSLQVGRVAAHRAAEGPLQVGAARDGSLVGFVLWDVRRICWRTFVIRSRAPDLFDDGFTGHVDQLANQEDCITSGETAHLSSRMRVFHTRGSHQSDSENACQHRADNSCAALHFFKLLTVARGHVVSISETCLRSPEIRMHVGCQCHQAAKTWLRAPPERVTTGRNRRALKTTVPEVGPDISSGWSFYLWKPTKPGSSWMLGVGQRETL